MQYLVDLYPNKIYLTLIHTISNYFNNVQKFYTDLAEDIVKTYKK